MLKWLKKLWHKPAPAVCNHQKNWDEERTLDSDGTPMTSFECRDCGMFDRGHVQADAGRWCGRTQCRNGQRTEL